MEPQLPSARQAARGKGGSIGELWTQKAYTLMHPGVSVSALPGSRGSSATRQFYF